MFDAHCHNETTKGIVNISLPSSAVKTDKTFSVGFHPWYLEGVDEHWETFISLANHPNCLAIGECGFDKHATATLAFQKEVFIKQIEVAVALNKPIIIHVVKAFEELIKTCKPYLGKTPFIIHGFNKNPVLLTQLAQLGFLFSFGQAILNNGSNAQKALKIAPPDSIFLETDDKEITIEEVYLQASKLLGLSLPELDVQISNNIERIFHAKL